MTHSEFEVTISISLDGKKIAEHKSSFIEDESTKTILNSKRILGEKMERMKKKAVMTYINGWSLNDNDGELHCIYCGNQTKGFDHGKPNKLTSSFKPHKDRCPCRDKEKVLPSPHE